MIPDYALESLITWIKDKADEDPGLASATITRSTIRIVDEDGGVFEVTVRRVDTEIPDIFDDVPDRRD